MIKEWSENSKLKDNFIQGYYIEESFCDKLIEEYKSSKPQTEDHTNTFRGYLSVNLSQFDFKNNNLNEQDYFNFLYKCLSQYSSTYNAINGAFNNLSLYKNVNFQHYSQGNSYSKYHCEKTMFLDNCQSFREMVFMTYLNDSEDGCTEFLFQNYKIYPKKGLTILWPAGWMFTHRGTPSKTDKYILTGWYMDFPYSAYTGECLEFYEQKNKEFSIFYQ